MNSCMATNEGMIRRGVDMLGRQDLSCVPPGMASDQSERYKRDLFVDMKIAIDCLKEFNEKLNALHPDVLYKIRQIL